MALLAAALSLESIDNIHSGDSLPLSVFATVGDSITDDIFKEDLELDTATGLFIDQARDTLDTTTASQTTDGSGLGDTLDVITQDFAMTLQSPLPPLPRPVMLLLDNSK